MHEETLDQEQQQSLKIDARATSVIIKALESNIYFTTLKQFFKVLFSALGMINVGSTFSTF